MRIGIEVTALHGPRSGVATYTANLLRHLWQSESAPDHEWLLFSNRPLALDGDDPDRRARIVDGYSFRYQSVWRQTMLPLALRSYRPAVCHYTNLMAPLYTPCPAVVTIHDLTLKLMPRYHPWRRRAIMGPLLGPTARRAERIITVSKTSKCDIVRLLKVPEEKVTVVYEAAAVAFRPLPPAVVAAALRRYSLDCRYILYVGTIEPRKNLVRLVRAFARLRASGGREILVLVGSLGWAYEPLFAEIERLGLRDCVVHLGYVSQDDLVALYNGAAVFVFPSLYEGFGLPPLEAMACGTPVITSATGACGELAAAAALQVDPASEQAIADTLRLVLDDDDLAARLRALGMAHAARFSWEQAARQTLAVYEAAATGARHAAEAALPGAAPEAKALSDE